MVMNIIPMGEVISCSWEKMHATEKNSDLYSLSSLNRTTCLKTQFEELQNISKQ